mmetsp:Transcript_19609/g.34678  ORF Transcript_19609/g.34678 Transcript_19609/m.34678 type:complete len:532 (-) Transcript_19609:189-1784(-)
MSNSFQCCLAGICKLVPVGWQSAAETGLPTLLVERSTQRLPAADYEGKGRRLVPSLSHTDLQLGDLYSMGEVKGQGSFGTVCRARSRLTHKDCVVKTMRKADMCPVLFRFAANEIAILSFCHHPNIVRLYHSFEDGIEVHCAMQSCLGGELEGIGMVSEMEALTLMQQVFCGIHYLHSVLKIAHRDMKLENTLLKYADCPIMENQVKIIDFGFAKHLDPLDPTFTEICGTPGYMAPEILQKGPYSEKCDIFSCGVMLYALLCGSCPFEVDEVASSLTSSLPSTFHGGRLSFQEPVWCTISGRVKLLLMQLCRANPDWRISAEAALEAIKDCCSPIPEKTHPAIMDKVDLLANNFPELLQELYQVLEQPLQCLREEALQLVAYHIEDEEVDEERRLFQMLDSNRNGELCEGECAELWQRLGVTCEDKRRNLFQRMDMDGTGSVSYTEFLSRALEVRERACSSQAAIIAAFSTFDVDNNGKISLDELKCVLQKKGISKADCQSIIDFLDVNKDGELDLYEFRQILELAFGHHQ